MEVSLRFMRLGKACWGDWRIGVINRVRAFRRERSTSSCNPPPSYSSTLHPSTIRLDYSINHSIHHQNLLGRQDLLYFFSSFISQSIIISIPSSYKFFPSKPPLFLSYSSHFDRTPFFFHLRWIDLTCFLLEKIINLSILFLWSFCAFSPSLERIQSENNDLSV